MMNTGSPILEFTLFPDIPTELRLLIWKHCRPEGRTLTLYCYRPERLPPDSNLPIRDDKVFWISEAYTIYAKYNAPPPSILKVNKESRAEVLKTYRSILPSVLHNQYPIYFDFSKDTLKIDTDALLELLFVIPEESLTALSPYGAVAKPRITTNARKEINELIESLVYLSLGPTYLHPHQNVGPEVRSGLKSLKVFSFHVWRTLLSPRTPFYAGYLQRWLETVFQTKWKLIEQSQISRHWDHILDTDVFENTGEPRTEGE